MGEKKGGRLTTFLIRRGDKKKQRGWWLRIMKERGMIETLRCVDRSKGGGEGGNRFLPTGGARRPRLDLVTKLEGKRVCWSLP